MNLIILIPNEAFKHVKKVKYGMEAGMTTSSRHSPSIHTQANKQKREHGYTYRDYRLGTISGSYHWGFKTGSRVINLILASTGSRINMYKLSW
jgi:hypothetical protein